MLNTPLRRLLALALPSEEREPDRWAHGLRHAGKWVLRGAVAVNGQRLEAGDGLAASDEGALAVTGAGEVMLFDLA